MLVSPQLVSKQSDVLVSKQSPLGSQLVSKEVLVSKQLPLGSQLVSKQPLVLVSDVLVSRQPGSRGLHVVSVGAGGPSLFPAEPSDQGASSTFKLQDGVRQ